MDEKLKGILSKVINEYKGGNPLEVQAATEVVYHLQQIGVPQDLIPFTDHIIYFSELYASALKYLRDVNHLLKTDQI